MAVKPKRKISDNEIATKGYQKEGSGFIKYRAASDSDKAKGVRFQSDQYKDKAAVEKDINSTSFRKSPSTMQTKAGMVKKKGK